MAWVFNPFTKKPDRTSDGAGAVTSVNTRDGDVVLTKADVGLSSVDDTSDADKPVSTAQQTALDLKADDAIVIHNTGDENIEVPTDPYSGSWDANPQVPTKADTYAAIETRQVNLNGAALDPLDLDDPDRFIVQDNNGSGNLGTYTFAQVKAAILAAFTPLWGQLSGSIADQADLQAALDAKVDTSLIGANDGIAQLDSNGLVPSSQLPSYVDDVVEAANFAALPGTGETGKIYVTLDDNKTYRWSGSAYVEISSSLALGETSATAYRGDRGKIAYDHSQATGNPHGATTADIADSLDKRYMTQAERTTIGNQSGTNTGDETTTTLGSKINGASAKTTPVDADMLGLMDSAASNVLKKLSWANVKATLKTYFDTLYPSGSGTSTGTNTGDQTSVSGNAGTATALQTSRAIDGVSFNGTADITVIAPGTHAATSKATPVDADEIPLVDSAASNVLKKLTWANLKATAKTYFDGLYQPLDSDLTTIAGLTATTDSFIVSVASAWAARTPSQVKATLSLGNVDNTSDATKNSATATVINKRIQPRVATSTGSSTLTPDVSTASVFYRTAVNGALTIAAPTGTPVQGETIAIYITDDGTARALTINAAYVFLGVAGPTTTVLSKVLLITAQYNGTSWLATWASQV